MQASLDFLNEISIPLNSDLLGYVAETAMIGKGAENALQLLSGLVVESLGIVSENVEEPGAENVINVQVWKGITERLFPDQGSRIQEESTNGWPPK